VPTSGDDQVWHPGLPPEHIGWSVIRCPRCMQPGTVDDVHDGAVIIRHDADTWHTLSRREASAILWDKVLRRPRPV
jgi:hypothetical protein